MKVTKVAGIALVATGALALSYGAFSYTKDAHRMQLGALVLKMSDRETVKIPPWVGLGSLVAGALPLLAPSRRFGT
jgi:hypothetical protein